MAQSYTEFYVKSSGSNANAGSSDSDTAFKTYSGGSWTSGTGVFDPAGAANPSSDGVTVGMWANIGGSYCARITAVSSTTFTVSSTAAIGTVPATGTLEARVGGRWKGPNGADAWPFNVEFTINATNSSTHPPRVNFYNDTAYTVSAAPASLSGNGPVTFQGMTSTPGDGGRASYGRSAGAAINLISFSNVRQTIFRDFIFDSNGTSSTAAAFSLTTTTGSSYHFRNCVFKNVLGNVVLISGTGAEAAFYECEFYNNTGTVISNTSTSGRVVLVNCIFHDNPVGTSNACVDAKNIVCINSIFDTNTGTTSKVLYYSTTYPAWVVINSDFYNNAADVIAMPGSGGTLSLTNCNFFKNGGNAITVSTTRVIGMAYKCAFGAGTQANGANFVGLCEENNSVTYTSNQTPWNDPANGDFSLTGSACIDTGRAAFVQTVGYSGSTTGYADIGAAGSSSGGSSSVIVTDY